MSTHLEFVQYLLDQLEGLGELRGIQQLFVAHAQAAMDTLEN